MLYGSDSIDILNTSLKQAFVCILPGKFLPWMNIKLLCIHTVTLSIGQYLLDEEDPNGEICVKPS
jgi:hypothetical protein